MLAPLSHPDIITIFDLGAYAHLHYIADVSVVGQQLVDDLDGLLTRAQQSADRAGAAFKSPLVN